MRKFNLAFIALLAFNLSNAQAKDDQLAKGKWLIEANTGFGNNVGNTSFSFTSNDGETSFNIGAEGGYFLKENLALKLGLGYGENSLNKSNSPIAYKLGVKYYLKGMVPLEISYNGIGLGSNAENPNFLGFQAGYAYFLGKNVSIEPGLRYNLGLEGGSTTSSLQFNIGFAIHL